MIEKYVASNDHKFTDSLISIYEKDRITLSTLSKLPLSHTPYKYLALKAHGIDYI